MEGGSGRGGVMSGSGLSDSSIFSSQQEVGGEVPIDTLSMLEQGAASYDGSSVPTGEEALDDTSTLSNQQRSTSAKVNEAKTLNI